MSAFDPQELVLRAFLRLRSRFKLGVAEYMAALNAIEGGFGADLADLEDTLKLLWCHSLVEETQFAPIWESVQAQVNANKRRKPPFPGLRQTQTPASEPSEDRAVEPTRSSVEPQPEKTSAPALGTLPIQAPDQRSGREDPLTLQAYYPISRRLMAYSWRYLRRPVADGPLDVLDIHATIAQVSRQGFYLAPVYTRRERNDARLLLLLDQNGSMTPFHHFTRDLAETALQESTLLRENVGVFYFQNVPAGSIYQDAYLTEPLALAEVLNTCDSGTSVLIVSDAGAARGFRAKERVRGTARFLYQLKRSTSLVAWLNPMPKHRWVGSSAEIIANSLEMFQMDNEGLGNAIDVLRGLAPKQASSSSL